MNKQSAFANNGLNNPVMTLHGDAANFWIRLQFKAMGMGLSDLAVASQVLKFCSGKKVGHELPERYRMTLPLQAVE